MSAPLELLDTLGDFTNKENWDKFFTIRGSEDAFEWYAEWPSLRAPLLDQLSPSLAAVAAGSAEGAAANDGGKLTAPPPPVPLQILVPGCGSSRLSEHLYDAGFRGITNIDFSKVVIAGMLRRNIRLRPDMRWRVMDMTSMQFADDSFDIALDKGGLDALMEPKLGSELGAKYLREVKRVVKPGGKFLCLTLAESHVISLLFSEFRFGWKTHILLILEKSKKRSSFQTFLMISVKDNPNTSHPISLPFDMSSLECNPEQGLPLVQAIEFENKRRNEISSGADVLYSLEELKLGATGDLQDIVPGRRCQLILGENGGSDYRYRAVLLDSKQPTDKFLYHCGVFIVPKTRVLEWLFLSEDGQWIVVENSKTARLIMVFLDSSHSLASMNDIQKDLSPLVKQLEPRKPDETCSIPFLMASDGVKERTIVKKAISSMTGGIIVEDVIYDSDEIDSNVKAAENLIFRRLIFERSQGLVQSEALLRREEHAEDNISRSLERKKSGLTNKSKKKGNQRKNSLENKQNLKIDHSYLAGAYHSGILSGFMLIAPSLESAVLSKRTVKAIVIGLGAGLFPMCLRSCLPFLTIEVVELDPVVFDLSRDHFGFREDNHLKVHICDGIKFVQAQCAKLLIDRKNTEYSTECEQSSKEMESSFNEGKKINDLNILIIDADSSDATSGLTCPPADFLEESFLTTVRDYIWNGGLFVVNLVSRSPAVREMAISRLKMVFGQIFCLALEGDVNEVLFALPTETHVDVGNFQQLNAKFEGLLVFSQSQKKQNIIDTGMKIKQLK